MLAPSISNSIGITLPARIPTYHRRSLQLHSNRNNQRPRLARQQAGTGITTGTSGEITVVEEVRQIHLQLVALLPGITGRCIPDRPGGNDTRLSGRVGQLCVAGIGRDFTGVAVLQLRTEVAQEERSAPAVDQRRGVLHPLAVEVARPVHGRSEREVAVGRFHQRERVPQRELHAGTVIQETQWVHFYIGFQSSVQAVAQVGAVEVAAAVGVRTAEVADAVAVGHRVHAHIRAQPVLPLAADAQLGRMSAGVAQVGVHHVGRGRRGEVGKEHRPVGLRPVAVQAPFTRQLV